MFLSVYRHVFIDFICFQRKLFNKNLRWEHHFLLQKCSLDNSVGVCVRSLTMFLETISEILGVCVGEAHFFTFVYGLFFLGLY